jgi:hypothetical protein
MNFKILERTRIKKNEKYKEAIVGFGIILGVGTVLTMIIMPILAAYNVPIAIIETDYWGSRFTYMFFYIAFNILICALPLFNNFMFFLSDGIILS